MFCVNGGKYKAIDSLVLRTFFEASFQAVAHGETLASQEVV